MEVLSTLFNRAMLSSCLVQTASDNSWCPFRIAVGEPAITRASSASRLSSGSEKEESIPSTGILCNAHKSSGDFIHAVDVLKSMIHVDGTEWDPIFVVNCGSVT